MSIPTYRWDIIQNRIEGDTIENETMEQWNRDLLTYNRIGQHVKEKEKESHILLKTKPFFKQNIDGSK